MRAAPEKIMRAALDKAVVLPPKALPEPAAPNDAAGIRPFGFVHVGALLGHLKPIDWLVRGYLEADSLALLFGDPGCGKSFVAVDLACAVATGTDWHGNRTKTGAVFYIAGEGHNGLARRFKAWEVARATDLSSAPIYVSHRAASLNDPSSAEAVSQAVDELAAASGQSPRLIVVDTLARNFGGADENSTADMNAFVTNLDAYLKDRFHACVLVVHHTGHADKTRARGAMALKGALDAEYQLTRDQASGVITLSTTKMKDAEPPKPVSFQLRGVELPFIDDDGQRVFGAAPSQTEYVAPAVRGNAGSGERQAQAIQALSQLIEEQRRELQSKGFDPDDAHVLVEHWKRRLADLTGPSFDISKKFSGIKASLEKAGRIRIDFPHVHLLD
jgi:hypothetical protein